MPGTTSPASPRRFRFSLRTLFVVVTVVAAAIAYIRSIDWNYSHVVSLDCGEGRTIDIYVETFCDLAGTPVYEVRANGAVISPKTDTDLMYECGEPLDPKQFRLVSDDSQSLFAVIYGPEEIAAIFDFKAGIGIPAIGTSGDAIPAEILNRLQIGAKN